MQNWPSGTVVTTEWLVKQGVSRQLANSYKKSGWIESYGMGAYKRPHETITWMGALFALQKFGGYDIHVGGKTALEMLGLGHYVRKKRNSKVILWKKPDEKLPKWFTNSNWDTTIEIRSANLFENQESRTEVQINGLALKVSSAEQAIFEYLHDVPRSEGWDEASYLMENLVSLRPIILQSLLEKCNSIKLKRLFLYLADKQGHNWFNKLEISHINLGLGKRQIIKGGRLDKKYEITVPFIQRED